MTSCCGNGPKAGVNQILVGFCVVGMFFSVKIKTSEFVSCFFSAADAHGGICSISSFDLLCPVSSFECIAKRVPTNRRRLLPCMTKQTRYECIQVEESVEDGRWLSRRWLQPFVDQLAPRVCFAPPRSSHRPNGRPEGRSQLLAFLSTPSLLGGIS